MLLFIKPSFVNELNLGEGGPPHPHVAPFPYPLVISYLSFLLASREPDFNPLPLAPLFLICPAVLLSRFRAIISLVMSNAQSMSVIAFRLDYMPKNSCVVVVVVRK